jgi:predicted nucleic acid-binding protein
MAYSQGMAVSVLLDSVILIDHLNGIRAATRYLESLEEASISVISRAEVLAGLTISEVPAVREWLDRYPTLAIDRQTADLAADLRRQYKWKLPDALQAAVAQQHGLQLATRNTKDFPPRRYSFVVVPYTIR